MPIDSKATPAAVAASLRSAIASQRSDLFSKNLQKNFLRTRFAPSPTGYLHLGHVAHALVVWGLARTCHASIVLRVEDHDRGRSRAEFEQAMFDDLNWLGLTADRGPSFGKHPSEFRQSDQSEIYQAIAEELRIRGLLYACECTRRDIAEQTPANSGELQYPGTCRDKGLPLDQGLPLRVRLPEDNVTFTDAWLGVQAQHPSTQCGAVLVRARDRYWTYQFAVVVDDLRHGINLVIRGEDILPSTGRQILLRQLVEKVWPASLPTLSNSESKPPIFLHHPLIRDTQGRKLSKRFFADGVIKQRQAGVAPEVILGQAVAAMGWVPRERPMSLDDSLELFGRFVCRSELTVQKAGR